MVYWNREQVRKIRNKAPLEILQLFFHKLGMQFAPFYWVQEGIFEDSQIDFGRRFEDYRCDFLEPEDIPNLLELKTWRGYSGKTLKSMFKAGNKCISTKHEGQMAAFMWIDLEESNCKWYRFPLKGDEAYLFDMFTLKAFRGKGVAPYLRYKSYEILKQMGRNMCYSYTDSFNHAATRFKKKLNAKILKTGLYFAISNKHRWLWDKDIGSRHYRFRSLNKIPYCRP